MATPTIYKSSDAGAPYLTTEQAYTVLKECLVTGYGAKAGAGWTLAFDDPVNKKAVFKNVHGDCALRVDASTNATYSTIQVADDFSDIDTPIGALWHGAALLSVGNYTTSTDRPWILFATDEFFIFYANNTASLTATTAAAASSTIFIMFGRASPLGDNTVENVIFATAGNNAFGGAIGFFALAATVFTQTFTQKDYLGGTTGARSATFYTGMVQRYESSPGVYSTGSYPGTAGPAAPSVSKVPGEKWTAFREDGSCVGYTPVFVPYFRLDPTTQGLTIDDTMVIDGVTYSILNMYNANTTSSFARFLVPHDGW
ncbi:hypothetical protein ACF8C6_09080 [Pseudomonas sp. zbq_18]|uniref:hypothetical protein n=1 Tax=Pseudomonas sp. zbq_18 TaxID=3367251 RepID=UPI00370A898B